MRVRLRVTSTYPNGSTAMGWVCADPGFRTLGCDGETLIDAQVFRDKREADDVIEDWKSHGWRVTVEPVEE